MMAGAWGGNLARWLGDDVPLEAHAPMLVITQRMPCFVEPVVGALGGALLLKQFDNGTLLIGGSEPGVVHAFGFSAHGFQLAPAVGVIVAHLALGETPNLSVKPFRVGRFLA